MATIYHQIGIKAPLNDVYKAIATTEGISRWWTRASGTTSTGGELNFSFDDISVKVEVTDNIPDRRIEWTVRGNQGEWLGTRICFDLMEEQNQVFVNFQHTEWKQATEMLAHCSTKWAVFLLSLKDYLETGTGKPFPHDQPVNHTVFN
jgi:uncharacterized protein YndB with AHSA1/START domain